MAGAGPLARGCEGSRQLRSGGATAVALAFAAGVTAMPLVARADNGTAQRSCAWQTRLDPTVLNTLFPDQAANYWNTLLPASPGGTLTIRGIYPHGRYISLTSYDALLRAVDGVNDEHIRPDAGSVNVFSAGADRTVSDNRRHFTVTVVFGQRPATSPDNTLYTTSADGSHSAANFLVTYRVYRADRGMDITGGEPLPTVTYNGPGGASFDIPTCQFAEIGPNGINDSIASGGSATSQQVVKFPGTNPPTWHKFFNLPTGVAQSATDNGYSGTAIGDSLTPYTTMLPSGGFLENLDNKYVSTQLSRGYGNIAVIHARLPTFAPTYLGQPRMGSGQLRYWSMCSNDGPTERYYGCLADDQVVTDAHGFYTVVVSTAAGRPANAVPACGVNWLPAGPQSATLMIMRNMLPAPGFAHSIQAARYGHEAQDMGDYYPSTAYMSTADFAASGCHPPTGHRVTAAAALSDPVSMLGSGVLADTAAGSAVTAASAAALVVLIVPRARRRRRQ